MLKSGAGFVQFSAVWGFTVYQVWENGEKAEQSRRIRGICPTLKVSVGTFLGLNSYIYISKMTFNMVKYRQKMNKY